MQICALNSKQQFLQSSRSIDLAFFVLKAEEILSPPPIQSHSLPLKSLAIQV